jgi:ABC-type antimicrobial peptide transport system permease subunit
MRLQGYSFLILRSIYRKPGRAVLDIISISICVFFFCFALAALFPVRKPVINELGRAFPLKRIIVKPKTLDLGLIRLNRTKLSGDILDKIRKIDSVSAVYPIQPISFPVRAEGTIFGQEISTDIVVNGVPEELVKDCIAPGEEFEYKPDQPVPVVISRYFLDIYNFGVAQSNNLPKFNEKSAIGQDFYIIFGESIISGNYGSDKSKRIACRVVGFTPDVSLVGVIMPLDLVKKFNIWYKKKEIRNYTLAIIEMENLNDFEKLSLELRKLGLAVESHRELFEQFRFALNIISIIILILAVCVIFLTVLGSVRSESLSLIERREEMGCFYAMGASRVMIIRLFLGEKMLIGVFSGITGIGIFMILCIYSQNYMLEIFEHIPVLGNAIMKISLPVWLPLSAFLFSIFLQIPINGVILYASLLIPPGQLIKK